MLKRNLIIIFPLLLPLMGFAGVGSKIDSWEGFWSEVKTNNPALQGKKFAVEAARSETVLPLPHPMVAFGSMGMNSPFSGVMERTLEVSQRIPFPTKFAKASSVKRGRVAYSESAEALGIQEVMTDAASAFISLDENLKAQEILKEHKEVLDRHVRRLNSLQISEQSQNVHILTITAESKVIAVDRLELEQNEIALRNQLGMLLNSLGPYENLPELKPVGKPPENQKRGAVIAIEAAKFAEASSEAEAVYAKQVWLPDLSLTYRKRNRYDGVMPASHELMIGIELPFLWGSQRSADVTTARARANQARFESVSRQRQAESDIATLRGEIQTSWRRISLLRDEVLPLQKRSLFLLQRLTASDMETLELHRITLEKWLTDQLQLVRREGDYRRTLVRFEVLTQGSLKAGL